MTSGEQIALVRERVRASRPPAALAEADPVARVAVDVPLAHLDRVFDYGVPDDLADAVPGTRVRVRFAGQLVNGWVLERVAASEHEGRLTPLQRLVSPDPVLAPEVVRLARVVADHYGGTLADVLRLAVPPRHASAEKSVDRLSAVGAPDPRPVDGPGSWAAYPSGTAYLRALGDGRPARAVWSALPGQSCSADHVADAVATAVATTVA